MQLAARQSAEIGGLADVEAVDAGSAWVETLEHLDRVGGGSAGGDSVGNDACIDLVEPMAKVSHGGGFQDVLRVEGPIIEVQFALEEGFVGCVE